MHVIDTLV